MPKNSDPTRRSAPRRLLNRLEIDRAVFFALAARCWQLPAGLVTFWLLETFISPQEQGYYYVFWSVIGLQMFFELGFPQAIINFASHEWEKLYLTNARAIQGNSDALSRLQSLARPAVACYSLTALAFGIVVTAVGWWMFTDDRYGNDIAWRWPWVALVATNTMAFWLSPLLAFLEGCKQVQDVYAMHLARAVLGNLCVWIAIPLGSGIWTPALATVVRLACELVLIIYFRRFFRAILLEPDGPRIDWFAEVWPFQWRLMIKGFFAYLNSYVMSPIIFRFDGAVAAGQFGPVWQVLTALQGATASWLNTRVAQLGILIARREFRELDRVFLRTGFIATFMMTIGGIAFWLGVVGLYRWYPALAARVLPPTPTALLTIGLAAGLWVHFLWLYIHAHRQSPQLLLSLTITSLTGGLLLFGGIKFGATGVAAAFAVSNLVISVPIWTLVWDTLRKQWHGDLS